MKTIRSKRRDIINDYLKNQKSIELKTHTFFKYQNLGAFWRIYVFDNLSSLLEWHLKDQKKFMLPKPDDGFMVGSFVPIFISKIDHANEIVELPEKCLDKISHYYGNLSHLKLTNEELSKKLNSINIKHVLKKMVSQPKTKYYVIAYVEFSKSQQVTP